MIGVVLAGGASRRFGGRPKGLLMLGGQPLAVRVANILAQFCAPVVIEAPPGVGYETLGYRLIHADQEHAGKGPLAGIAVGLALCSNAHARVAFAPCDMPNLNGTVYGRLIELDSPGAYACTSAGVEPLVAVLRGDMRPILLDALNRSEMPRTHAALDEAGAKSFLFDDLDAFANVNSPGELSRLEALHS